ncbi:uncharacterized protein LOC130745118 [Lotus japonicus]|uniref:uncharacterized protein LOC130745118 n=1 Tax=Lotus japonicus TaxID=34305 RepID=UPI0025892F20|nr:uncharacterized protein LOC130745118 [Lotus japonicus]
MLDTTKINVLAWNVRGAANASCKRNLKEVVRKYKPDVCFLFETHIQFRRVESYWARLGYRPLAIEEARGQAGGVWALGLIGLPLTVDQVSLHPQAISLRFRSPSASWVCTGVYASPIPTQRHHLWEHLRQVEPLVQGPWAMIGDFNDIAVASEQRGGTFSPSRATAFVEGYESCGMMDLGSFGLTYTWNRHAQGRPPLHRRLDRALANVDWRLGFPNGSVEVLPRMHSDHSPLLLRCCPPPPGIANKPFRFEAAWMDHPQYATVVSGAWEKGGPNFVSSMDCVRQDSLLFNHEVFGNIFRRKRRIADQIRRVQERLETVDSAYLHRRLGELRKDQEEVLAQEEMLWFQKSREKWVRYGDRNTSFFHAQTIIRRRRNHIQGLELPDGS